MKPGPKKFPENLKRKMVTVKLPPFIIEFLRSQDKSQSDIIIDALVYRYPKLIDGIVERAVQIERIKKYHD